MQVHVIDPLKQSSEARTYNQQVIPGHMKFKPPAVDCCLLITLFTLRLVKLLVELLILYVSKQIHTGDNMFVFLYSYMII